MSQADDKTKTDTKIGGEDKSKLILPTNFRQMLIECIDPYQSCDYLQLGGVTFPVQLLCIGPEKKIIRLSEKYKTQYEKKLELSVSEICRLYDPSLGMDWLAKNATLEDIESFYLAHFERLSFNDEISELVNKVISLIDWKPIDDRSREEARRYFPAYPFLPCFTYNNIIEGTTAYEVFRTITRGHLEIMKLNNIINSDRMKIVDKEKQKQTDMSNRMNNVKTADEFMAGLSEQGFSIKDMM